MGSATGLVWPFVHRSHASGDERPQWSTAPGGTLLPEPVTGIPPLWNKLSLRRTWGCVRHLGDRRQLNSCLPKFIFFKNMHDVHSSLPQTRCIPPGSAPPGTAYAGGHRFFHDGQPGLVPPSKCSIPVEKPAETMSGGRFQDPVPLSISARRLDMYVATIPPTAAFHALCRMSRHGQFPVLAQDF